MLAFDFHDDKQKEEEEEEVVEGEQGELSNPDL